MYINKTNLTAIRVSYQDYFVNRVILITASFSFSSILLDMIFFFLSQNNHITSLLFVYYFFMFVFLHNIT